MSLPDANQTPAGQFPATVYAYKAWIQDFRKEVEARRYKGNLPVWRSERERSDQLPEEDLSNVRSTDLDNGIYHSELEVTG